MRNVLSLFNGMSCLNIALERAGLEFDKYYSAEIDKYAIQVTQANYPDTIQLGDVTRWREWDIDWSSVDLVTGGFPCQAWSIAGKQLGDKDERGMLFWVMLDIMKYVRKHNPNAHFLIENVKMKKEFEEYITHHTTDALGEVHKILINSALVSAQNRNRYYWTSWECTQPEDRGIMLADIVEENPKSPTIMSERFCERNAHILRDDMCGKAKNLSAMEYVKNGRQGDYIIHQRSRGNNPGGIRAKNGKTPTLSANSWEHNNHLAFIEKSKCVRSGGVGSPPDSRHNWDNALDSKVHYRKLTPRECERLQTVPDDYTSCVSNTQRYKMLGNGWTVDVITHIFIDMVIYG